MEGIRVRRVGRTDGRRRVGGDGSGESVTGRDKIVYSRHWKINGFG